MSKLKKIVLISSSIVVLVIALVVFLFFFSLRATGSGDEIVNFVVTSGDSKEEITDNLKEAGLIRSKYATLIYIVLSGNTNIQAGNYEFNRGMSTKDIVLSLANGDIVDSKRASARITFKEGIRLEEYMKLLGQHLLYH